jgi:hypothetical protein
MNPNTITRRNRVAFLCKLAHGAHGQARAILLDFANEQQ